MVLHDLLINKERCKNDVQAECTLIPRIVVIEFNPIKRSALNSIPHAMFFNCCHPKQAETVYVTVGEYAFLVPSQIRNVVSTSPAPSKSSPTASALRHIRRPVP